jgi:hypothetical protein
MDALFQVSTTELSARQLSARRSFVATAIGLALAIGSASTSAQAFALDQPVPSDASTRKGAAAQEPCPCEENSDEQPTKALATGPKAKTPEASNVTLAQWVSDWMKNPRRVTAKLAIHGVVPEIELEAVLPASQNKSCVNGTCDANPTGTALRTDITDPHHDGTAGENPGQEQISEAPVAPPIPPSFPFAMQDANPFGPNQLQPNPYQPDPYQPDYVMQEYPLQGYPSLENQDQNIFGTLSDVQVTLPASTLVAYIVAHAQNSVRLEMSQQLAAERAMYAQRYELLLQHNQQLQTQLAMIEARQESAEALAVRASTPPQNDWSRTPYESTEQRRCQSLTASREDLDAIQEDLSNIRKQIAILKTNSPIPFAPSYVGTEEPNGQAKQPQAWRTARTAPYTPVFPGPVFPGPRKSPEVTKK